MATKEKQQAELEALAGVPLPTDYVPTPEDISGPEKPRLEIADALTGLVAVAFKLVAARRGDHWNLKPEESQELGGALGDVVNKYFPDVSMGPLPVLGGVMAMVLVPRIMHEQKLAAEAAADGDKSEHQSPE